MSALDQAFIKAYAKEPSQTKAAVGGNVEAGRAQAKQNGTVVADSPANSRIENIYAAGALYRIETPRSSEPEPVPPPHFANRGSRRLPLRYRLAQMDLEEASPPVVKRVAPPLLQPAPSTQAATQPKRRAKAQIPPPPPLLPPAPLVEFEEPGELLESPSIHASSVLLPATRAAQGSPSWDQLIASSMVADSALVVWPREEELASSHAGAHISLELDTLPSPLPLEDDSAESSAEIELPETGVAIPPLPAAERTDSSKPTSHAKTIRIDAAHPPVSLPHQPPQPTVEELIKPAADPPAAIQTRPLVISEAEAAELVGAATALAPAAPDSTVVLPLPAHSRPLSPAWEVDRFLWPALCEKLLRDDHSYFAQAGGKIVSAVRDGLKSLAITGSRRGEGRTTLALCLARSAAQAGLKVALVDADFARPQLAASLGLEVAASWHEAALGTSPLSESAVKSMEDNITVLPLDASTAAAALSLADPRLTKTLREAASAFDLLVLDLGPTAAGEESLFPENESPPADAAIVVRDLRYCTPSESQAIGERLSLSGIEAVGIAENFVPQEKLVA